MLTSLIALRGEPVRAEALELAGTLARLLGLSPVDAVLLRLMVACGGKGNARADGGTVFYLP